MNISDIVKNKRTLSFEFFPPKDMSQESVLFDAISQLKSFPADFVSITYGAGGSTRDKTTSWTQTLSKQYNYTTMMHLTCYGNTPESVSDTCEQLANHDIKNVLALRGDLPVGTSSDAPKAFDYACNLVSHIKRNFANICVGVAGYPEKHPQAKSIEDDISHAKAKMDAGADFIITQLFFDNDAFYRYLDRLDKNKITIPVIAGIMPIVSYNQTVKFTEMCGTSIPQKLLERIKHTPAEDIVKIGIDYAVNQCQDLIKHGVNGLHFYTLNKSTSTYDILMQI